MSEPTSPTWCACMTPPGKAAVATLAVRGPLAWSVTRELFQPRHGALPEMPSEMRIWLGRLGTTVRDEVVLAVKRVAPEPWLEIHCHGGLAVVQMIEGVYVQRGVRLCSWQDLERHTSGPAWKIAAQQWLVQAPTGRTAAILLDQYEGAFHRAILAVRVALDAGRNDEARQLLNRLTQHAKLSRHLVQPWSVVIAGAPNVGKSSLVNALAGYTRSVVAPTPGTTRDVTTTTLAIDGWPISLHDTAGLREASNAIEAEGIARAWAVSAQADLCLWVLDGAAAAELPKGDADWRIVINKCDLPSAWDWTQFPDALRVSAQTRMGVGELCEAISRWLVPNPPVPGEAVPFSPQCCDEVAALASYPICSCR